MRRMKVILQRVWGEPAVAIGLIATLILLVLHIITGDEWDANAIIAIAAPFVSALGIRQTVKPALGTAPTETPAPEPPPPIPPGDPEPGDKAPTAPAAETAPGDPSQ